MFDTLQARKFTFQAIDIASPENDEAKAMLRESSPQKLVVPQIYVDGEFRAGYAAFVEALENSNLESFLSSQGDAEFPLH